jgi:hypothetical protein
MTARTIDEQLDKYLADVHSIEEQALTQLRRAPDLAGDERLAVVFERFAAGLSRAAPTPRRSRTSPGRRERWGWSRSRRRTLTRQGS